MKDGPKRTTRLKLLGQHLELAQVDGQGRKQAAAVLEVLAGLRTPQQAAQVLGLALPSYFNLETRALRGLVFACCAQPPGRQPTLAPQLRQAQARAAELQRQVGRYQALLRTARQSVGLPPASEPRPAAGTRRKPRKPAVRALRVVKALAQAPPPHAPAADMPGPVGQGTAPALAPEPSAG